MSDNYTIPDGDAVQALDQNTQQYQGQGYGVTAPGECAVTINSGTLDQTDTLSVAAGTAYVDGTSYSISSQNVQINSTGTARKDLVVVDNTGSVAVLQGDPADPTVDESTSVSAAGPFQYETPTPPDLDGTTALALAEVFVPASTSSITASELNDRRVLTAVTYGSVETDALKPRTSSSTPQSVYAAASRGFVVALSPGTGTIIEDPRDYSTDEQATQACVDWLVNNADAGVVYQPHANPSGGEFTWASTVSTPDDDRTTVSIKGVGAGQAQDRDGGLINVTITDGSPAIHLSGKPEQSDGTNEAGDDQASCYVEDLQMWANGRSADGIEFREAGHHIANCELSSFNGDMVRITGRSFNGFIRGIDFGGGGTSARGVVFADDALAQSGSDWTINGCAFVGTYDNIIETTNPSSTAWNRTRIVDCHAEGAQGTAAIEWVGAGQLYVVGGQYSFNDVDGIHVANGDAVLWPSGVRNNGGDGIRKSGDGSIRIATGIDFGNTNTGDAINIQDIATGSTRSVVPYEDTIEGTVTYTSPERTNLRYPDGYRLVREGSATITAGTSSTVETFGGNPSLGWDEVKTSVAIDPANTPTADVEFEERMGWDTGSGQPSLTVEETTGAGDVTILYRIYRR